jgi:hypothetical protein
LVDAVRQNLAGAGADLGTVRLLLDRVLREHGADDLASLWDALQRLQGHLEKIGRKTDLAMNAPRAELSVGADAAVSDA